MLSALGVVLFELIAVGGARSSPAPKPPPIQIEFDAPGGCPGAQSFYDGVRARVARARLATGAESALRIRVRVVRALTQYEGELRIIDERGETARQVDGASCDEVVAALAFTAALALDPASTVNPSSTSVPPPTRPRARPFAIEVGAQVVMAEVVSPFVSVGGALLGRVTKSPEDAAGASIDIALLHARNDFVPPASRVSVRWTVIGLTACPWGWKTGVLRMQPCVAAAGGWLAATDEAVTRPASVLRSWWSAGVRLRAGASLGRGYTLELEGGVGVPLLRRRFVATSQERIVGETPSLSASGGVGLAYRF